MKKIKELDNELRRAIVSAISNNGIEMEGITSIMLDGEWKYCDTDEELKEAIKELFDEEFDNEDDFNDYIRSHDDSIIVLFFDPDVGYLINVGERNKESENETDSSKDETKYVNTLSVELKKRIACQLEKEEFDDNEIAEIVFAPDEGHEWLLFENANELKEAIQQEWGEEISEDELNEYVKDNSDWIITLNIDSTCLYLVSK